MTHSTPPSLCECEQEVPSLTLSDLQRRHSKMASRCRSHSLNPRLSLWLLALVLTWHSSVTESHAPIQLRGEVGGKVAFHCPVDKQRPVALLYFQRGEDHFINGYHESHNITATWRNTILDEDKTTIHMNSLNVSHNGAYKCIIRYRDNRNVVTTIGFHLTVTAKYSKPALVVQRSSEKHNSSCLVTCTSHGGYPDVEVKWQIPESCTVLNNSKSIDRVTMMVNRSSTAECNCSGGELTSICSVGNVTSDPFSVCTPIEQPDPQNPYMTAVAIALIAALLVLSIVGALLWWKCRKPQRGAVAVTRGEHEHEELVVLNENKEGKEAP